MVSIHSLALALDQRTLSSIEKRREERAPRIEIITDTLR